VYWDKEKKTFGEIEVEVTNTETSAVFITRNMLIRHVKVTQQLPVLSAAYSSDVIGRI